MRHVSASGAPVYVVALLRDLEMSADLVAYLEAIDATLEPYGGRFDVHGGGAVEVLEDEFEGFVVLLEFPDRERARAWYRSDAYQEILPLRTRHSRTLLMIVDGVPADYRAAHLAARLRRASTT